ncbi:hypothetical protein [Alicyclobacillus fastidiosus]|uniref:Terminase small subunit n=1 Tax=Alicyclobacillus fastidiosus TaxID=392011 RepID=A0ABV5AM99_9BACL|nr:hypothetical protein [Alicyclobacillus fastidiosus]WEH08196.1 hypothetical protein PYS47_15935 [Alicyclobacillus fastidiosus]
MDKEYIDELKKLGTPKDDEAYTTVADHDETLQLVRQDANTKAVAEQKKRARTYAGSELPVRPCTSTCPKRGSCKDFLTGRVQDGDLCKPELRQIKKWQTAFRRGDLDRLKDDVGAVAGALAVQINRLLDAVIQDGAVIEQDKFSASGDHYTELVTHPALKEAAGILKTLGIDLNQFLMTPKAAKDAGPQVQFNVGVTLADITNRYVKRITGDDGVDDS